MTQYCTRDSNASVAASLLYRLSLSRTRVISQSRSCNSDCSSALSSISCWAWRRVSDARRRWSLFSFVSWSIRVCSYTSTDNLTSLILFTQPVYPDLVKTVGLERYQVRHPIPNTQWYWPIPMPIPIPVHVETLNWMQVKNCASQHTVCARVTCCHEFNLNCI